MENTKSSGFIFEIIRGVFTALITTLIAVLIFAGVIKIAMLNDSVIKAVNQFIKVLAVFIGCFFSLKNNMGLIKGLIVGGFSAVLITLVFALIGGSLGFGFSFIIDIIFMAVIGGVSGIISVNLKK